LFRLPKEPMGPGSENHLTDRGLAPLPMDADVFGVGEQLLGRQLLGESRPPPRPEEIAAFGAGVRACAEDTQRAVFRRLGRWP
jgi:hypothetical protein